MKREASGSGGAGQQGPSTDPSSGLFTPTYRDTVRAPPEEIAGPTST